MILKVLFLLFSVMLFMFLILTIRYLRFMISYRELFPNTVLPLLMKTLTLCRLTAILLCLTTLSTYTVKLRSCYKMGVFADVVDAGLGIGKDIYNIYDNERKTRIAQNQFDENMELAKNALGYRISDAERNGISKWAVAGDGATAGAPTASISSSGAKLDNFRGFLAMEQMKSQTQQLKNQENIEKYNLDYAKKHGLPYGSTPSMLSELLNALDGTSLDGLKNTSTDKFFKDLLGDIGNAVPTPQSDFKLDGFLDSILDVFGLGSESKYGANSDYRKSGKPQIASQNMSKEEKKKVFELKRKQLVDNFKNGFFRGKDIDFINDLAYKLTSKWFMKEYGSNYN